MWIISHILGLSYETMVRIVCLAGFFFAYTTRVYSFEHASDHHNHHIIPMVRFNLWACW